MLLHSLEASLLALEDFDLCFCPPRKNPSDRIVSDELYNDIFCWDVSSNGVISVGFCPSLMHRLYRIQCCMVQCLCDALIVQWGSFTMTAPKWKLWLEECWAFAKKSCWLQQKPANTGKTLDLYSTNTAGRTKFPWFWLGQKEFVPVWSVGRESLCQPTKLCVAKP